MTVVKALDALLEAGLVIKRHGKGTEVNLPVSYNLASGGFSAQLQNSGTVSNRWLVRKKLAADDFLARELEIAVGDRVAKIKRVRLVDASRCLSKPCLSPSVSYPARIYLKVRCTRTGRKMIFIPIFRITH